MDLIVEMAGAALRPLIEIAGIASAKAYWLYLLCALLLALLVYVRRAEAPSLSGALRYLFPKRLYTHVSAIADYKIWFANAFLFALGLLPTLAGAGALAAEAVGGALASLFGAGGLGWTADWRGQVAFTLCQLLAIDAAFFVAHYLQHRVPLLWEFHKVHHSAEVLVPVTVFRMHPVDLMLHFLLVGLFAGAVLGAFSYAYAAPVAAFAVNGLNLGLFLFYVAGVHLRHSHVWLMYPGWFGRHLSSPALHQIHHSSARQHADKNLGQIFTIWDRLAGTLYLPEREERLQYGLWEGEHAEFRTLRALYFRPFLKAARLIRLSAPGGRRESSGT